MTTLTEALDQAATQLDGLVEEMAIEEGDLFLTVAAKHYFEVRLQLALRAVNDARSVLG